MAKVGPVPSIEYYPHHKHSHYDTYYVYYYCVFIVVIHVHITCNVRTFLWHCLHSVIKSLALICFPLLLWISKLFLPKHFWQVWSSRFNMKGLTIVSHKCELIPCLLIEFVSILINKWGDYDFHAFVDGYNDPLNSHSKVNCSEYESI